VNIRKLIIEDVRCFAGRQEFNIRPLTFLVGENSTGKSTVLACFETLTTFMRNRTDGLDFNVEPYQMGSFVDIVRKSNPRKKRFRLGVASQSEEGGIEYILECVEREKGSEPVVLEERCIFENGEIVVKEARQQATLSTRASWLDFGVTSERADRIERSALLSSVNFGVTSEKIDRIEKFTVETMLSSLSFHAFELLRLLLFSLSVKVSDRGPLQLSSDEAKFQSFLELSQPLWKQASSSLSGTRSFAPIRSKPQRTYNPLKEAASPEGSDVPVRLMNMSKADSEAWQKLRQGLVEFGKASGLFTAIDVRRLGKSTGDPFQLQIKVKGPKVNMIDVGYGVNQLLPILVRIFSESERTTFLMQQPEVHLHPRGQAELSSLLIDLVKQRGHKFIIETHSDSMIDRTRIEIMKKRISQENVSLIYLEPVGNSVKVHNIAFDEQANFISAPGSYRDFFLHESDKLLGFA